MRAYRSVYIWAAAFSGLFAMPGYAAESAAIVTPPQAVVAAEHASHAGAVGAARMSTAARPAAWTAFPTLKTKMSGDSRERREIIVIPQNMAANRIDAYSNDIEDAQAQRLLALDMAGARLGKPGIGGFHWLAAREEQGDKVRVASVIHFSSERGGKNPAALFMLRKNELEIIPQPYPREHSRYRANERWKFLVRFNGKPLPGHKVFLETANGSKVELHSDAQGVITLLVPDDFRAEENKAGGHDHGRRSADFVLATEHAEGGRNYLTAFNASYGADALDKRSLAMGLGFTLLGMIGAVPLLRQRKPAKQAADIKPSTDETAKNERA